MRRRLLRLAAALAVANCLAMAIVWACGPDYAPLPTVNTLEPGDPAAFYRGEIGVVRPRLRRATLAMAYRVLNGRPPLQVNYPMAFGGAAPSENAWRKIREQILGPLNESPQRTRRIHDYVTPINCLQDAFDTAIRTFYDRERRYGSNSAALKDWVQAQASVFANCDEEPLVLPAPAAATADALTKADRAYQTAAAYFYAMQFDESARRFRAIADDASSPWRPYGRYLAARSAIRVATMTIEPGRTPEALAQAEKALLAVLADPVAAPVHNSTRGLLTFVRVRLRPLDQLRELSTSIEFPLDEIPSAALADFTYLMDRQVGDQVDFDYARVAQLDRLRRSSDLVDWIVVMQGRGPAARERAIARWQATSSAPWLVAALWHLREPHELTDPLLLAAAAVQPSSPAFPTVAFLRVRLLIALGRIDAARSLLATLPDSEGPGAIAETINLYRGARLMVASTFEEFLKATPRLSLPWPNPYGIDVKSVTSFDEDGGVAFAQRMPLDRLVDASVSTTLPQRLRTRVAVAAFTRAILLDRHDRARRVAPALRSVAPPIAADLDRYLGETTDAGRRRAAVLLILRTPGMTTDVRGLDDYYSWDVVEPRREFESFMPTWWCGSYPNVQKPVSGEASSELIHTLYADHIVPYPAFISAEERSAVEQELIALEKIGHAAKYLATGALEWARERPRDPETAEALSRIVTGWRRACRNPEDAALAQQSFKTLHRLFPTSEWTQRTPYWYR